jgi:hypothetical protein
VHTQDLFNHLQPLPQEAAERWIDAALAEAAALRQHDDQLYPARNDPGGLAAANQLHKAWEQWAQNAEALLNHVDPSCAVPGRVHELRDAIGRTLAMLKLSPELILRRQDQLDSGDEVSVEEVRRELRLKPRR